MDALLIAVLNALWQGTALIALVTVAMRAGLRRNATTACVVWTIAFGVIAALPFVDLASNRSPAETPRPVARVLEFSESAPLTEPIRTMPQNARAVTAVRASHPHPSALDALRASLAASAGDASVRAGSILTALARTWGTIVIAAWALAAGLLLVRLAGAYRAVARVKRSATPIGDPLIDARLRAAGHRRSAAVAASDDVGVPCAIGFVSPMIVIPAALVATLDREDLARVVLHESAHLQRYDDWTNLLEQVVCAVQFFQPALYLARRCIDFEREIACDDRVLADAGDPLRYAECLARIVQRQRRSVRLAVVPGFAMRRAHVLARVRRIVDGSRDASPQLRAGAAVAIAVVVAGTLGIARLQVPLVAPASATTDSNALQRVKPAAHADRGAATARVAPLRLQRVAPLAPTADLSRLQRVTPLRRRDALQRVTPLHRVMPAQRSRAHAPSSGAARGIATSTGAARADQRVVALVDERGRVAYETETGAPAALVSSSPRVPAAPRAPPAPAPTVIRVVIPPIPPIPPLDPERAKRLHELTEKMRTEIERAQSGVPNADALRRMSEEIAASTEAYRYHVHVVRDGDLLDAIDAAKYPRPSVDELIALRNHGVSGNYVRRMGALGPNRPSLHDMTALADQGIGPSYVQSLTDAGMRDLSTSQLIALHAQGVDGAFVRRLAAHGYKNLSVADLIRLRTNGI